MSPGQCFGIAARYTFSRRGSYLSGFLSRLSMLGIVLSIALLVVVLSVMNGFDREMRDNILSIVPQLSLKAWSDNAEWQDDLALVSESTGVIGASPYVELQGMLVSGGQIETTLVNGLDLAYETTGKGVTRLLNDQQYQDFSSDTGAVLLGSQLGAKLLVSLGDVVTLVTPGDGGRSAKFEYLRVAGLLHSGTEWDQSGAIVHLEIASDLAGLNGGVHGFRVVLEDVFSAGEIGWQLISRLPGTYYASDWTMTHGNLYAAIQLSRDLVVLLLFSVIAIAAFNVVSSLVLVVLDKQGEIAILRAMGATPGNVRSIFLAQGLLIALVGITVGSTLGALLSQWASELVNWIEIMLGVQFLTTDVYPIDYIPADLRWQNVLLIALVTAVMCFFAAIYPAQRAARSLPAEVLRHE